MAHSPTLQNKETISVASYNCLANDYLHYWNGKLTPSQQTYTQQPAQRLNDVVQRIKQLNADVVCLQEVSTSESNRYSNLLGNHGYVGMYEQFSNKPDGVAIYIKAAKFKEAKKDVLSYSDTTGRKALFLHLTTYQDAEVDVVSTHFQGGPQHQETAKRQIQALVQKVQQAASRTIVCADCNFTPQDPRFQIMSQYFYDALNGQSTGTSMNDKTPMRLDYIWHTASLAPVSAYVCGNIQQFLTSAEPSDHVPLMASFDLPILTPQISHPAPQTSSTTETHSLNVRNKYPGTDLNPSFKRKIFNAFNACFLEWFFPQIYYDQLAPQFEAMIDKAEQADRRQGGSFLPELYKEIALHSRDAAGVNEFCVYLSSVVNFSTQNGLYNDQPFNSSASFRFKLFESFNQFYLASGIARFEIYHAIAPLFSNILAQADQAAQRQGGNFVSHVTSQIDQLPDGYAKGLLNQVMAPYKTVNTVSTIISTTFVVPAGKTLAVSGNGPLGNWDRKVPLKSLGNNQWALTLDGQFPPFEYKFLLDDRWEQGNNRPLNCGKKDQVSSIQF